MINSHSYPPQISHLCHVYATQQKVKSRAARRRIKGGRIVAEVVEAESYVVALRRRRTYEGSGGEAIQPSTDRWVLVCVESKDARSSSPGG
jgi:hypothetical protein